MTEENKVGLMNPHFGGDTADSQIQIWINPEIPIQILDYFWLRLDASTEVCTL